MMPLETTDKTPGATTTSNEPMPLLTKPAQPADGAPADRHELSLPETHRVEGFSDGAFSIIITLLVLEIHRPAAAPGQLGEELLREWPSYLAYAIIAILWAPAKQTG